MADNALVVNTGTALTMASDDISNVHYPRVKIAVGPDNTAADWAGTIGTVSILTAGTVDTVGLRHADAFGSRAETASGTGGANIHGAVSGSQIFVTDLVISVGTTAMQVSLHPGGTANTAVFGPYTFAANGGIVSNFRTPRAVTSGSALVFTTNADGTVTVEVDGYID